MRTRVLLLLIILVTILLRLPALGWGVGNGDRVGQFEPDEWVHANIAVEFINRFDKSLAPDKSVERQWTTQGFGVLIGALSYPVLKIDGLLAYPVIVLVARLLSLFTSVALILLVFWIAKLFFEDIRVALLSATFIGIFDLTATYSHYGTPDILHTFWFYASVFALSVYFYPEFYRHKNRFFQQHSLIIAALSSGLAIAFRYEITPLILFAIFWIVMIVKNGFSKKLVFDGLIFVTIVTTTLFFMTGFGYSVVDFTKTTQKLIEDNPDPQFGSVFFYKPLLYLAVIIAGTSLPIFLLSAWALILLVRKDLTIRKPVLFFLVALFIVFIILELGPVVTVRRANVFMPFVSLISSYGLIKFLDRFNQKLTKGVLTGFVIGYTLLVTLFSQYYFYNSNDPRYQAENFINSNFSGKRIYYSNYAQTERMTRGSPPKIGTAPEIVVMHETLYSRYWKSLATPFKIPVCCDEVFHCVNVTHCKNLQEILEGGVTYRLIRKFEVKHPLPERIVFKKLFGNYETFLGDLLVYQKESSI